MSDDAAAGPAGPEGPDREGPDPNGPDPNGSDPAGPDPEGPAIAEAIAQAPADLDIGRLFERVEQTLLGGERHYTPAQVAERSGASREEIRLLWRALGFATGGDDEAVYTDGDIEAVRTIGELRDLGFEDPDVIAAMTRLFGQTFSRLASWQGQLMLELLAARPELLRSEDALLELLEQIGPRMESLQAYVWRRQLVAFFARAASRVEAPADGAEAPGMSGSLATDLAIGFVDMSGFTALTRRASEAELRALLDRFETLATTIVGEHGGRIVKTIGDEVLFQADAAADAAEIALDLVERAAADDTMPQLRGGVAYGPVVSRLGDVYGSTVNIASRLVSISRPGTVLVDKVMRERLQGDSRYYLKTVRPESVRGFSHLRPWRLRRAER